MPRWIYRQQLADCSPLDALRFEEPLAKLKDRLESGEKVFENLLSRIIVENGHRNTIELTPDKELGAKLVADEEAKLAKVKEGMSDADVAHVIAETSKLKEAQLMEDSPEDLATIPRVGLADLERTVKTIPTEVSSLEGGGTLLTHPIPTAGVVYADVLLDLEALELDEIPLIPLFTRMLLETGTSDLDAVSLQRRIGARTGGISISSLSQQKLDLQGGGLGKPADPFGADFRLAVRAKGTVEKAEDMFSLVHAVLTDAQLDSQDKVVQLLTETKSRLESAFVSSGNSFAGSRLRARESALGVISEMAGGVTYYETVKEMLKAAEDDWPSLLKRLETVRAKVVSRDNVLINLTVDDAATPAVTSTITEFVTKLPETPAAAPPPSTPTWRESIKLLDYENEAYAITTQVNYVAAGCSLIGKDETAPVGKYGVVARFLSRGYLWDNVRVVGGAYGGGCTFDPVSGAFSFSSYRDPNLQGTLETYAKTVDVLANLEISDDALEQAIVGAVGDLDSPMSPDAKGYRALGWYLTGMTTEARQAYRDEMIATTREDFAAFGEKLRAATLHAAVFGSLEAIEKANEARADDEKLKITKLSV